MPRVRSPGAAGALLLSLLAVTVVSISPIANAQTAPASPPTTSPLEKLLGDILGVTTVAPPPPAPTPAPAAPPPRTPAAALPTPATTVAPDAPRVVPAGAQRVINSVRRTGPRNTSALLDALRRLEDLGFTPEEAAVLGMGRFPVAGAATYRDDWLEARFTPTFHHHQGTDIFAPRGTPVIAPADGVVRFTEETVGGKSAYVTMADGTFYYMTHLNGFSRKLRSGAQVRVGEVVAYVGNTGNASDGAPHVHFEVHPRGGAAVNPKPILDGWLDSAIEGVPALLSSRDFNLPRAITFAGTLRRFEEGPVSGSSRPNEGTMLWATAVSAGGGTLSMAGRLALRAAERVDWTARATEAEAMADRRREARVMAHHILDPLTPSALESVLGEVSLGSS